MEDEAIRQRVEDVKSRAHGRWEPMLGELLKDRTIISRKNQPCPKCRAGEDRFQYTDKFGNGDAHCRFCGHLDGFALLESVNDWTFWEAFLEVERVVGAGDVMPVPVHAPRRTKRMLALAMKVWNEARPIEPGDEVDRYLRGRGLGMEVYPGTLRSHPGLGYYVKQGGRSTLVRRIPAMLAVLQDACGEIATLHRTYIENGRKALVPDPKKCLTTFAPGAAIRLLPPTEELAVAEGIETALAVHLAVGKPVWAGCSASNMGQLAIPPGVRRVCVYADNDANFTGQAAAYALAHRLMASDPKHGPREVEVFIPPKRGVDWADIWLARRNKQKQAA